jgi:hypothetical protein
MISISYNLYVSKWFIDVQCYAYSSAEHNIHSSISVPVSSLQLVTKIHHNYIYCTINTVNCNLWSE